MLGSESLRKTQDMKGMADPKTSVVTTTIIRVVVMMTPRLGMSTLSFRTRANAIVPRTSPARKRNWSSLKLSGIFLPKKILVRINGSKIDT